MVLCEVRMICVMPRCSYTEVPPLTPIIHGLSHDGGDPWKLWGGEAI